MGRNSAIEWTHHTFNPWWGCAKVSTACEHCYAESWAKRVGHSVWGRGASRRFFGDRHWSEPLQWNREAAAEGIRKRVFCASMGDVFEPRKDLEGQRERLWDVIARTERLDWLLVTNRPWHVLSMVPWKGNWPDNVWLGVTVENQRCAERRIPLLVQVPAHTRFLSCEPLLGNVDLSRWVQLSQRGECYPVDWVIAGGESGPLARPLNPEWARSLRDQCIKGGIAFHFKQWGHWAPIHDPASAPSSLITFVGDGEEETAMVAVGKKNAGRLLDGRRWDEFPARGAA